MASHDGVGGVSHLTREELIELVEAMRDDWHTLNTILNTQATAFGWCGEYEERVDGYNKETRVLKMVGRGNRLSVRNAYAARRLVMGHVMTTLERHGIELPKEAWGGVVRDYKALANSHEQLIERLRAARQQSET
jgi:hypothetical protein